jgi:hypothetical protein
MLNYLHILHFHLNHATNKHVVPLILGHLSDMKPYPAGQRLLKLLCMDLNDTSLYRGWRKLAFGAYGTIYECHTELAHPQEVAIKVAPFKESIYDRCVLHDIFAEITCLEYFRLQPNVTTLFDYGVAKGQYYIVMKKYKMSLKKWREEQTKGLADNLPSLPRDLPQGSHGSEVPAQQQYHALRLEVRQRPGQLRLHRRRDSSGRERPAVHYIGGLRRMQVASCTTEYS